MTPLQWGALAFAASFVVGFAGLLVLREPGLPLGGAAGLAVAGVAWRRDGSAGWAAFVGALLGVAPWLALAWPYRGMGL